MVKGNRLIDPTNRSFLDPLQANADSNRNTYPDSDADDTPTPTTTDTPTPTPTETPTPTPTPTDTPTPTPTPILTDLRVTITDGRSSVTTLQNETYTIVVTNLGPNLVTGAAIADSFPSGLSGETFTASQNGGASGFTTSGVGNINDTVIMPAGSNITYKASGKISASATGTLSDTAMVTAPSSVTDTNPSNNIATDTDTVVVKSDLKVTITDGKASVVAGQKDTYTIAVTNAGPGNVLGATINDSFPSSFVGVMFTASQSGGASGFTPSGAGDINDTVTMPAGSKVTYKATGKISRSASGTVSDSATVVAPSGVTDPNLANNTATDTDSL